MTTEKILEREHGKGHVTATTVPCKLQQLGQIPRSTERINAISKTYCDKFKLASDIFHA